MFSTALFHNYYMIVLGNEHMTVDLESSKRVQPLAIEFFSEGFRSVMCSHHNCPIRLVPKVTGFSPTTANSEI